MFKIKTANEAWFYLMRSLHEYGNIVSPREIATKEIVFKDVTFDMRFPVCYHQDRRLNYTFSAAEALFIANGDNRVENLGPYNKNIAQFSDDGLIFNGSYGPPFNSQLGYVVNVLRNDPFSRQAVLTIWKPNPVKSRDIRCTIALQFLIRNGRMHTKVTMRSSDVWLGIPYDFFNFTVMTLRVLTLYNRMSNNEVELGTMNWSAGSSHAYVHDTEKIKKVLASVPNKPDIAMAPRCIHNWQYVVDSLVACRDKNESAIVDNNLWRIRP